MKVPNTNSNSGSKPANIGNDRSSSPQDATQFIPPVKSDSAGDNQSQQGIPGFSQTAAMFNNTNTLSDLVKTRKQLDIEELDKSLKSARDNTLLIDSEDAKTVIVDPIIEQPENQNDQGQKSVASTPQQGTPDDDSEDSDDEDNEEEDKASARKKKWIIAGIVALIIAIIAALVTLSIFVWNASNKDDSPHISITNLTSKSSSPSKTTDTPTESPKSSSAPAIPSEISTTPSQTPSATQSTESTESADKARDMEMQAELEYINSNSTSPNIISIDSLKDSNVSRAFSSSKKQAESIKNDCNAVLQNNNFKNPNNTGLDCSLISGDKTALVKLYNYAKGSGDGTYVYYYTWGDSKGQSIAVSADGSGALTSAVVTK